MKRKGCVWGVIALGPVIAVAATELWIGADQVSITPERPISLAGQFHQRISKRVESPCVASVLALESRVNGSESVDQAILISMDVVSIPLEVQRDFRAFVGPRLPGFDTNKLFLAATHTHTGPTLDQARFSDYGNAMQPKEYLPFLYERLAEATVKAWESRKRGAAAWGLGHAVVGHNRRVAYANGKTEMYGKTGTPAFRNLEGWEDHAVDILCFTDADKKLIATAITVPCPSQTVEGLYEVSADYWHHVREDLKAKYGSGLTVLTFCGPGGDTMPRPMVRSAAESRMERLRKLSRKQEVARRIVSAFDETWAVIQNDLRGDLKFVHRIERFEVPRRKITEQERGESRTQMEEFEKRLHAAKEQQDKTYAESRLKWFKRVVELYDEQQTRDMVNRLEVHVLRLGDVAIASNPFELFQDYAMRIHGRSPAEQTVLIQLASPADERHSYLPSQRAVEGGGYSAVPQSTPVGPEGGQMLVDRTVEAIQKLFGK